jgi:mRNA-degrading endonuclease RelE of RelBE toxin-antitoxin system
MRYIVEISARARKQIKRLQKGDKKKVLDKIESLRLVVAVVEVVDRRNAY